MMRLQRARDGGSRVEMQVAKWTAEGAVKGEETPRRCGSPPGDDDEGIAARHPAVRRKTLSILRRKACVSCREYVGILQRAWVIP